MIKLCLILNIAMCCQSFLMSTKKEENCNRCIKNRLKGEIFYVSVCICLLPYTLICRYTVEEWMFYVVACTELNEGTNTACQHLPRWWFSQLTYCKYFLQSKINHSLGNVIHSIKFSALIMNVWYFLPLSNTRLYTNIL